ncbi:NADP-dependent oxidoreductase, partial [Pseudomonas aeruginosa]
MINRQIVLSELPRTALAVRHFQGREVRCPVPADGELLLRVLYIPLDAASRAWMQGATYRPGLVAGEVMAGLGLAEVVESRSASP